MTFTSYIHKDDLRVTFKDYVDFLYAKGYGDLNNDALWKWSSIMYSLDNLGLKSSDKVVDIGGGRSPLTKILSNECHITNVDINPNGNWFPLNEDGDYIKASNLYSEPDNMMYVNMNFLDWSKDQPDSSIDFMYDSCSIIHFDTGSTIAKNDGCFKVIEEVYRLLKPFGYFIVASDLLHPIHKNEISLKDNKGEFLYFDNLLDIYSYKDMVLFGQPDFSFEEDFNTNILEVDPTIPNYNKLNHNFYSNKEDWQTFCHKEAWANLTRGRCVFIKDSE